MYLISRNMEMFRIAVGMPFSVYVWMWYTARYCHVGTIDYMILMPLHVFSFPEYGNFWNAADMSFSVYVSMPISLAP
jgi:hypothetical protein